MSYVYVIDNDDIFILGARRHHRGEAEVDDRHVAVGVEEEEQVLGLGVDVAVRAAIILKSSPRRTRYSGVPHSVQARVVTTVAKPKSTTVT